MAPETTVTVLMGDLEGSRQLEPSRRQEVQAELTSLLAESNRLLGAALLAPLTLTAGDEFQGVLIKPARAGEVIYGLSDGLRLVGGPRIDFGLGLGTLSTALPGPDAAPVSPGALDGPAFHRARAALKITKREKCWVACQGFGQDDAVLGALFSLMAALRDNWTERQHQIATLSRAGQQKDLAAALGVSPSVVSESLKAANAGVVQSAETVVGQILERNGS